MSDSFLAASSSQVFSTASMREILAGRYQSSASNAIGRILSHGALGLRGSDTVLTALERMAGWLRDNRRSEYIYKNAISNKILIGRHSLRTATLLGEFKVGVSKVDCVIVNGHATAYEIKTELDSSARLRKQLSDYQKAFQRVVVVTHHSLAERYGKLLEESSIGILSLSRSGSLSAFRDPVVNPGLLSVEIMMKSLRKTEYTRIISEVLAHDVDVPNTLHFRTCLELSRQIPPLEYAIHFEDQLRRRRLNLLLSDPRLTSIRYLCAEINPGDAEYSNLCKWLMCSLAACTSPI